MQRRSLFLLILLFGPLRLFAQSNNTSSAEAIRVYVDCSWYCDNDFMRTEINYVNWVRQPADAQVHVIVSRMGTGGGGAEFTFTFSGRKNFAGQEDTLRYTARVTDSDDVVRRSISHVIKVGLVPFIARTPGAARLKIGWGAAPAKDKTEPAGATRDPWDFWVFTLRVNGNINGEQSQKFGNYRGSVSANRTTVALKVRLGVNGSYNESDFEYEDEFGALVKSKSISKRYSMEGLVVRSRGQHWSYGGVAEVNSSTYGNVSLGLEGGPSLEYSIWPYAEATRRAFFLRYTIGVKSYDYREITIYDKLKETHPVHDLNASLDLRQHFGSVSMQAHFTQYLHNTSFYNASLYANADVKLFKGFSLNFYGEYARVHDQLALAAGDLTPEEVLLQLRQRKTDYNYWGGFGVSYSFGSIFNNVVNPRFND